MLCEDDAMTFTASGEIFTHLLLNRGKTFELFDESLLDLGNLAHNVSVNTVILHLFDWRTTFLLEGGTFLTYFCSKMNCEKSIDPQSSLLLKCKDLV